jgi:FtsP/CotA-like multicopper oxidase with cupredoxin domain
MRRLRLPRSTSATPSAAGLLLDRRTFIGGFGSAIAMTVLASAAPQPAPAESEGWTVLRITEAEIDVNGKKGKAYAVRQADGTVGYVGTKGERFKVVLQNHTREPLAIHWHGILLPNGQDGVPYVTQVPIKPGEERRYDFPIVQAGTYWMHSHFGLQEQGMMTVPLILKDPANPARGEQEVVMMLNDFSFRDPADILAELRGQKKPGEPGEAVKKPEGMGHATPSMPGTSGSKTPAPVESGTPPKAMPGMALGDKADLIDVKYDALLTNRRSLADPEVVRVQPGRPVRLRVIAAGSATNFFIDTGKLETQAIAVDGEDIVPLPGNRFELAVAQRLDLRVHIPTGEGAYPIVAQGEGTDMRTGLVLATPNAIVPTLSPKADVLAGALTNAQELQLRAARPLPAKPVDRTLQVTLNGDMANYVWGLNGQTWPNITPLEVKKGERVELVFTNQTGMSHPMHLHGHVFQVTEVDGRPIAGAMRDTVLVAPRQTVKVQFDAAYPGYWMLHCHILYHQATGMMTVLKYEGFEDSNYNPLASRAEFAR